MDLSAVAGDMKSLIESQNLEKAQELIKTCDGTPAANITIKAPIYNPQKVICVGLNYSDHCTEQNKPLPKEPLIFNKFPSTIIGPGDEIKLPKIGCNTDLEAGWPL